MTSDNDDDDEDEDGCGSFPVSVTESDTRGRDCVAVRSVACGEVVLRVAPLAAVPTDTYLLRVCSGCFRAAPSAAERRSWRCPRCECALLCPTCASRYANVHSKDCSQPFASHMRADMAANVTVSAHRQAGLHADECLSLRLLATDPALAPFDRKPAERVTAAAGGSAGELADSSSFRLLLRLAYAHAQERSGRRPPLQQPDAGLGTADSDVDVIDDDFATMATLEDHWSDIPPGIPCTITVSFSRPNSGSEGHWAGTYSIRIPRYMSANPPTRGIFMPAHGSTEYTEFTRGGRLPQPLSAVRLTGRCRDGGVDRGDGVCGEVLPQRGRALQ